MGSEERPATGEDMAVALGWLLIDRGLVAGGGTPARRYGEQPGLSADGRGPAKRISEPALGARATDVFPGSWLELDNVLDGTTVRVTSPHVSRGAVRWHVLVCRVMPGGPMPSLWGGAVSAAFHGPNEEAELCRIAEDHGLGGSASGLALERALVAGSGEPAGFVSPSRSAGQAPYTLEGDLMVSVEAVWGVRDPGARSTARTTGRICWRLVTTVRVSASAGSAPAFPARWLAGAGCPRRGLDRGGPVLVGDDVTGGTDDVTSLGTFSLSGDLLELVGMSERRLEAAVAPAGEPARRVRSIDEVRPAVPSEPGAASGAARSARRPARRAHPPGGVRPW